MPAEIRLRPLRLQDLGEYLNKPQEIIITPVDDATPIDTGKASGLLTRLAVLLENNSTETGDLIESLQECLGSSSAGVALKKLDEHLQQYDFEEAMICLKQIEGGLESPMGGG